MLLRYLLSSYLCVLYDFHVFNIPVYTCLQCVYGTCFCTLVEFFVCFVEKNTQIITEERGLQDILIALDNHGQCKDLCEAACSALWSLSMEGIISLRRICLTSYVYQYFTL